MPWTATDWNLSFQKLTEPQLFSFALESVNGMVYLSQQNIVHRDLAARNCLYVCVFLLLNSSICQHLSTWGTLAARHRWWRHGWHSAFTSLKHPFQVGWALTSKTRWLWFEQVHEARSELHWVFSNKGSAHQVDESWGSCIWCIFNQEWCSEYCEIWDWKAVHGLFDCILSHPVFPTGDWNQALCNLCFCVFVFCCLLPLSMFLFHYISLFCFLSPLYFSVFFPLPFSHHFLFSFSLSLLSLTLSLPLSLSVKSLHEWQMTCKKSLFLIYFQVFLWSASVGNIHRRGGSLQRKDKSRNCWQHKKGPASWTASKSNWQHVWNL